MSEHRAWSEPSAERVRATADGEVIAESAATRIVHESVHGSELAPVRYFPPDDVRADLLLPTDHHTSCPIKGQASYYSVRLADRTVENAAWYYPEPLPDVADVPNYLAFYPDKVELSVLEK